MNPGFHETYLRYRDFAHVPLELVSNERVPELVYDRLSCVRTFQPENEDGYDAHFRISTYGITSYISTNRLVHQSGLKQSIIHIVDTLDETELVGYGRVRRTLNSVHPHMDGMAFVCATTTMGGYSSDPKKHIGQGLGTRRLLLMNALSQQFLGGVLHSGNNPSPSARRLWENLVAVKAAVRHDIHDDRYKFIR